MRLFVNYRTEYRFSQPQQRLIQMLRVTPPSFAGQQIIDWQINVECDARLMPSVDGFGNETQMLYVDGPIDQLSLTIVGEVLTENRHGIVDGTAEPLPPMVYLRPTLLTKPTHAIMDFAQEIYDAETSTIARLHRLMGEINGRILFDVTQDDVYREAGAAFAAGHGVCQDHAQIFITAAREMGIPARYVSGHLYRRDGEEFQPAAHAWAEAYVEDLGWVAFDPANAISPDEAYIRIAIGLDYRDAAPLSGARRGGGSESLSVGVTVSQARVQTQN